MSTYDLLPLDVDLTALDHCAALLGQVLSPTLDRTYLNWLYADNPAGRAVGFNAYDGDLLAAHYATIPVEAWIDGRMEKGLMSLNTATHPAYQGKGLFPLLAERTYARATELGYGFVVGIANARSTRGFTEKLAFQLVAPLDVEVGMGDVESGPERGYAYAPHWTDEAIAWRLKRPRARYVANHTHGDTRDVFARISMPGLLAFLHRVPASLASALPPAPFVAPFRLRIGLDRAEKRRGAFVPVPDRLKPSPLNLIFRDLRTTQRTLDANHVRWTLFDFDAY